MARWVKRYRDAVYAQFDTCNAMLSFLCFPVLFRKAGRAAIAAPMRTIGEVDYKNARIVVEPHFGPADENQDVAVVGHLYARERLAIDATASNAALTGRVLALHGASLQLVGIYAIGNDFGSNHVFVPIETFHRIFKPGEKLSKIRVTLDSIDNVETVMEELKS